MKAHLLSITAMSVILSACGGGGSDSGTPEQAQNTPPIVDLSSQFEAPENSSFEITASASDSDGSISGYEWTVVDGGATIASGAGSKTVSLTLPAVEEDKNVTVKVRVTDNGGKSTEAQTEILVEQVVPEVSAPESVSGDEKAVIELAADVAVASGNIASVQWSAADDSGITFTDAALADTSATLPSVSEKTTTSVSITVTDNDGDSVTTTTSVVIEPITIALTLEGATGSTPVTNAGVTLLLDGNALTTDDTIATDSDGHFTANVDIDDDLTDALVSVKVAGVEEQAHVSLISHLDSVNGLLERAGDDHSLSYTVFPNLTVSEYTTAKHAVISEITGNQVTLEEFRSATLQIPADFAFEATTAVKVLIEQIPSARYTIPATFTDILSFVENREAFAIFANKVKDSYEGERIWLNLTHFAPFVNASFNHTAPSNFFTLMSDQSFQRGPTFTFEADGSGQMDYFPMSWTQDGAHLIIKTDPDVTYDKWEYVYSEYLSVTYSDIAGEFTLLYDNGHSKDILYVEESTRIYTSQQYPNTQNVPHVRSALYTIATEKPPMPASLPSEIHLDLGLFDVWAEEYLDNGDWDFTHFWADTFMINDDGTAIGRYTNKNINWVLEDNKLVLSGFDTSNREDVTSATYELVSNEGVDNRLRRLYISDTNEEISQPDDIIRGFIEDSPATWTDENVPGVYGFWTGIPTPLDHTWYEFNEDNTVKEFSTYDDNDNGIIEEDEIRILPGVWRITDRGDLYFSLDSDTACTIESEDCTPTRLRTWDLVNEESDKLFLTVFYVTTNSYLDYELTNLMNVQRMESPPIDISGLDYQAILKNSRNKEVSLSKPDMLR